MFLDYLLQMHRAECRDLLEAKDSLRHYSVRIDFLKLFELYPDVGDAVLCTPVATLPACDRDLVTTQEKLLAEKHSSLALAPREREESGHESGLSEGGEWTVKRNVHARFYGLPVCPELQRTVFPKNRDVGCFLKVTGTVVRATQSKMLEHRRIYVCTRCRHETRVEARYEERYVLRAPARCRGPGTPRCRGATFTPVSLVGREHCKDYQELKIQEQVNKLSVGSIPGAMWVSVEDDLVDCCKPGDDVNVWGVLRRRWRPPTLGKQCEVELVLQANHVTVCNAQRSLAAAAAPDVASCFDHYWGKFRSCPLKGRDAILAAVCPQVYGLHLVKLALLLTVISGSDRAAEDPADPEDQHQMNVRGQCHLLLVGDPGTGKSQLLRAGAELSARSVFTSGTGSTRAGLTCAALREDGEWQLEAGALVLSDGGVCCIDEIGQLREHDRTGVHEAMEQQTISVAKAGIVCKLNTRCAVIGACNPKGHYQPEQPLSANVSLGTPLLSRFDLIFILLDTKNEEWDELVSSYILFGGTAAAPPPPAPWSSDKLQMYIGLVGPRRVEVSESAHAVLRAYYMLQRRSQLRDPSRTTVRMLDSLVRLSQAHCRLMYREVVLATDAVMAVSLVDLSQRDCTLRDTADALHSPFPRRPDLAYLRTARRLLAALRLPHVWAEELLRYATLLGVDRATLESEIDSGSSKLFEKFDDVADDNIPLSCSLVTSSYFHNKGEVQAGVSESDPQTKVEVVKGKTEDINLKLAATLKKHSSIKKATNMPVRNDKNMRVCAKRKRKELIVDNDILNVQKINKKTRSISKKRSDKNKKNVQDSDSSEEIMDPAQILKHVPSVNDIFVNLDINMSLDDEDKLDKEDNETVKKLHCVTQSVEAPLGAETTKVKIEKTENITKTLDNVDNKSTENLNMNGSFKENKLNQFKFVQKHDLDKFYETRIKLDQNVSATSETAKVVKLCESDKIKCIAASSSQANSGTSSQISMFDSSDQDVDLEL